ncbi:MAG: ABC transporter ATP-binding protein [Pseudonocardiales bacterium]|nr:ABC transporter ATP-binding protein [Pseudonocardiales bacterium]MBV9031794.1 ABC transporter ATP-binding protein [Pseudonocardiales bacterium]
MTSSESGSRLAGTLARFAGPQASTGALRASGSRLLKQSVRQAPVTAAALAVVTLGLVATTVLMPGALAATIDAATTGWGLAPALVMLAVVIGASGTLNALDGLIGAYYGSSLTAQLRHRLLGRALALGVPGQRRFPAGDLLSRLTANAGTPAGFLPMLLSAGSTLLTAVGAVVGLTLIDWRLALTFLLGVPPAMAVVRRFVMKAGDPMVRYQELLAATMTRLLDAHRGVRTIRAGGTAQREIDRILQPLPELHDSGRQLWVAQGQASWRLGLLAPMLQVLVLSVGGFALSTGDISVGQLVAASSYVGMALGAVGFSDALISLLTIQAGAGRVGEVLEAQPAVAPPFAAVPVPQGPGRLELRDVSVRIGERMILDRLSLSVPAGTSVAVVGGSGTGKSVLVSLAGRLLDPDEGEVLLDGAPVSRIELAALRRAVTYAFERPGLLGATVHDMIAYVRPEASRAEVAAAAATAQADRFIRLLPEGYDTPLARAPMSGGELQRLGLARAILADARVVVLDDATSSLDTATEVKVAQALERVLAGRTSLVVAHRGATAARADLVAWLDAGRIRALAPHQVLWSDPGYRAVFAVVEAVTKV